MTEWCILRTTPGSTIALAAALAEAGFTVWTPIAKRLRTDSQPKNLDSVPLVKPRFKKDDEITLPVVPTYVFASYDRVADLLRLADAPSLTYRVWDKDERRFVVRGRPHFIVFRTGDIVPRVPDLQLGPLREEELLAAERSANRARRKRGKRGHAGKQFNVGTQVRAPEGPYAGLDGQVIPGRRAATVRVAFAGGAVEVEIAPWLLEEIPVDREDISAIAA